MEQQKEKDEEQAVNWKEIRRKVEQCLIHKSLWEWKEGRFPWTREGQPDREMNRNKAILDQFEQAHAH